MIDLKPAHSRIALALSVACLTGAFAAPASAQGFFDQLFGGSPAQPAQQTFGSDPTQPAPDLGLTPLKRPKKVVILHHEPAQQRQRTTDLWHDKTLQPGDAIMMKDGLHVYTGPEASKHTAKQFVALDRARHVAPKARLALVAMDTTRNDPLRKAHEPDTLASGRSAAVGTPINKGYRITDARGESIRYVGP